ncbi:MAG: SDR family oxidoreductase [Actinobacteria bacterium]|nr:SDR family oxidoreductase [Actinomycetota bacterium]
MPDMGHIVHVIDRSGDVEGFRHIARLRGRDNSDEPRAMNLTARPSNGSQVARDRIDPAGRLANSIGELMGQLDGRVAVITGGGRGIGEAIALRYAAEGATVVISSRTASDLENTLSVAGLDSDRGLAVVADATDRDDARRPVLEALERFGRVDILVNNVGGSVGNNDPFLANDDAFESTLVLCLTSAWWTTSAVLPSMRDQGFGRIISIGSGTSKTTGASLPYTTAKHALVGFTKELAKTGAPFGINANLLCPGWTRTSLVDFERIATARGTSVEIEEERAASESLQHRVLDASELTGMATLLASDDGRGITGQVISVDGGYKV